MRALVIDRRGDGKKGGVMHTCHTCAAAAQRFQ